MDKLVVVSRKQEEVKDGLAKAMRWQMTPAEERLWQRLRRNQLQGLHFRRQQIIDGFIADFYCHEARIVIEADGGIHDERTEYDKERDTILAAHNLCIMRFANKRILTDMTSVLAEIAKFALERLQQFACPNLPLPGGKGG